MAPQRRSIDQAQDVAGKRELDVGTNREAGVMAAALEPTSARELWKVLTDNATALVDDARILLEAGSFGRARSLTVLAQEELGKALWLYDSFQVAWSSGDVTPLEVRRLEKHGRDHVEKYMAAVEYGDDLAEFWGDNSRTEGIGETQAEWIEYFEKRRKEAESAARRANIARQRGFYVDTDEQTGALLSPSTIDAGSIAADLQTAAKVIEMELIRDHTRMKHDALTPYDGTFDQQRRLLPISHPEGWAAASDALKRDGHGEANGRR